MQRLVAVASVAFAVASGLPSSQSYAGGRRDSPLAAIETAARGAQESRKAVSPGRQREAWTVSLPRDRRLDVAVTVGDVRIQGEARSDALIEVVRSAPTPAALARVPVTVHEETDVVRVSALQVENGTEPALRTDVSLRVPRDSMLQAIRIMEGGLTISSFAGRLDASVRRGSVEASDVEGTLRIETEIGDITATRARLVPAGLLRLRTFNGNVRLALTERPTDARILALALNGQIRSDIPLTMKDTWGPRWGEATLGAGEPVISVDVVTGRIEITVASR